MKKPDFTTTGSVQCAKAEQDLSDINFLKAQGSWGRYVLRRLKEHEDAAREAILADGLTPEERHEKWVIWKHTRQLCDFPAQDERSARKIIES